MTKHIGCMNDWSPRLISKLEKNANGDLEWSHSRSADTTPAEYLACCEAKHRTVETKKGNCWYGVYCPVCDMSWEYDCSD